jgi:hypothetical protein
MGVLKRIGGVPTLMSGRRPLHAPIFCLFYDQALKDDVVSSLYANGTRSFAVRNMIGAGTSQQREDGLKLAVDRLANVARLCPDADIIADCYFYPCEAWLLKNPHECYFTQDCQILVMGPESKVEDIGRRRDYLTVPGPCMSDCRPEDLPGENLDEVYGRRRVSPFSMKYAEECARSARRLIDLCRGAGIDNLWGIFVENYNCGEWNLGMYQPDHSRVALKGFRQYLKREYEGSQSLGRSWKEGGIRLATAMPPAFHSSHRYGSVTQMSPAQMDYRKAEAWHMTEQFLAISRSVKKHTPALGVGGFYPVLSAPQSDGLRLYSDASIDFIATPLGYDNRSLGYGIVSQSPFCDGLEKMGKVFVDELDTRTHMTDPKGQNWNLNPAKTEAEAVEQLWRDVGQMLVRGHHGWWLDFSGCQNHKFDWSSEPPHSWHMSPGILKFHKQFNALWRDLKNVDRSSVAEIVVFTPFNAALHSDIGGLNAKQRHIEWNLLGIPVRYEPLENLLSGKSKAGRLNLLFACNQLEMPVMKKLCRKIERDENAYVWLHHPGLLSKGFADVDYLSQCVGMACHLRNWNRVVAPEFQLSPEARKRLGIRAVKGLGSFDRVLESSLQRELIGKKTPTPEDRLDLDIYDPSVMPLILDDKGKVRSALREKASGGFVAYYPLPVLNNPLFRELARMAGCHVYSEKEIFLTASRGLMMLHSCKGGEQIIRLPKPNKVTDLRTGKSLGKRVNLKLKMARGTTRLLRLEV